MRKEAVCIHPRRSFAKDEFCWAQAFSMTSATQAFCVLSPMIDCMYQTATVPVLLLHLSCSIFSSSAGRQQAVTLLYKLCDFTCKRDLQHTQLVSRCCDVASALMLLFTGHSCAGYSQWWL